MTTQVTSPGADGSDSRERLPARVRGTLDVITDTERRTLRPIGTTAREVADRTDALLAGLSCDPAVWIFQGVRPSGQTGPPISHAISAGNQVMLIESVAWPPGRYAALASGDIHCGDRYIGQSVRHLTTAIEHWRQVLPPDLRVSAMVIVHPAGPGEMVLPATPDQPIAWAHAHSAVGEIWGRLRGRRRGQELADSRQAVAALTLATAEPG